jgi:hypothetical protein
MSEGLLTGVEHLSRELKLRAQQSVLERHRLVAANLLALGLSAAVAHRLGVSRRAHRWYRAWRQAGSRHYALVAQSAGTAGCCARSSTRLSTPCSREPCPTGSLATRWVLCRCWRDRGLTTGVVHSSVAASSASDIGRTRPSRTSARALASSARCSAVYAQASSRGTTTTGRSITLSPSMTTTSNSVSPVRPSFRRVSAGSVRRPFALIVTVFMKASSSAREGNPRSSSEQTRTAPSAQVRARCSSFGRW